MKFFSAGKNALFVFLCVVTGFCGTVISAELLCRVCAPCRASSPDLIRKNSLRYAPALFARHVFPQEARSVVDPVTHQTVFYINGKGYRGPDFSIGKPAGTVRIICYGGSSVFDQNETEGNDWPHRVEVLLKDQGFSRVEVINAGIPGHATFDAMGRLFAEGHLFKPDFVVLYGAWNDIKLFRSDRPLLRSIKPYAGDPRTTFKNGVDGWLSEHSRLYYYFRGMYLSRSLKLGAEGRKASGDYASKLSEAALRQYRLNIEMFVDLARNIGAVPILMTEARLVAPDNTSEQKKKIKYEYQLLTHEALCEAFKKTDEILRQVSEKKHTPLFDASGYMTGKGEYFSDHIHLSSRGSEELARLVASYFASLLLTEKQAR